MKASLGMAFAGAFAGPAAAREFRVADTQPFDYPTVRALLHLDRLVQERSGGRHSIRVFHSSQLGEERETIEQTRVGAIDINRTSVALFADLVPEASVLTLPFLFRSSEHMRKVLDGPIGEEILDGFKPSGFIGLTFYESGARSVYNAVRPIRTPADLAGLRIRVQQTRQMVATFEMLGAEPVPMPFGQVLTGLVTGIVHGAENNWPSYVSAGHFRHARHLSPTKHTMLPDLLLISLKAWAQLDAAERAMFREAARESSRFMRAEWIEWEARSMRAAEQAGVTITHDVDRPRFAAALEPVYDRFIVDPRLGELVERIRRVE